MTRTETRVEPPPEPRRRSRRPTPALRWLLVGFLVALVVAELGTRAIAPRLPAPAEWFSPNADRLVREMDAVRAAGVRSDLTVTGSSMAGRDLVPQSLMPGDEGRPTTHNVALGGGGQTSLQRRWLLEEVQPRLRPRHVVWGVSSLDFNATRRAGTTDRYDAARATRRGLLGAADRKLAQVSALARHRAELRDPWTMLHVLTGTDYADRLPARPWPRRARFELGYNTVSPARLARLRAEHLRYVRQVQLAGYRIGDREVADFRAALRELRRRDVDVAVVLMPVTSGYIAAHPHGAKDFERWKRVATAAAEAEGVPVLDHTRTMPDTAFRDYEHLNVPDARAFSARVGQDLRDLGWEPTGR